MKKRILSILVSLCLLFAYNDISVYATSNYSSMQHLLGKVELSEESESIKDNQNEEIQFVDLPIVVDNEEFEVPDLPSSSSDFGLVYAHFPRESSSSEKCTLYFAYQAASSSYAASAIQYDGLTIKNTSELYPEVYYSYSQYTITKYFGVVATYYQVLIGTFYIPTNVSSVRVITNGLRVYINSLGQYLSVTGVNSIVGV